MDSAPYQVAFNRYLHEGKVTARQMARQAGVSAGHIRAVARGDTHLGPNAFHRLSGWLVDEMRLTEHVEGFLGRTGEVYFCPDEVENDDDIKPEVFRARNAAGEASQLNEQGKEDEAIARVKDAIEELYAAVEDLHRDA
jgi:transcriptional regulator with XRE-family HTH domain